jgi:hypothetical protein
MDMSDIYSQTLLLLNNRCASPITMYLHPSVCAVADRDVLYFGIMTPRLKCTLLVLGLAVLLRSLEGGLLDIYGPVKVLSSSTYRHAGALFHPLLAIQADTSHKQKNCFISKNESNPWFSLQFKSVTSIQNVRLVIRNGLSSWLGINHALRKMNDLNLFVYVSNSSVVGSSGQQLCKHWKYQNAGDIMLICRKGLKGQFLHIALRSTLPTILIICGIVVNAEPGTYVVYFTCLS